MKDSVCFEAYLLKLLLILLSVALLHMPFLGFGTAECDEALETLQALMLVLGDRKRLVRLYVEETNPAVVVNYIKLCNDYHFTHRAERGLQEAA